MTGSVTPPCAPHLSSGMIAIAIVVVILCSGRAAAIHFEQKTIHATAPKDFFIKNQGLAFQRAAAHTPDILLFYGSSELTDPVPNRAPDFFAFAPTGFEVCLVGKAGATSLIILQKLGALGSDLSGKKVAISISPSFFFRHDLNTDSYAGNFSVEAATATLFGTSLDADLKSQIAKRMSQFPNTLAKSAVLKTGVDCMATGSRLDRTLLLAIYPLGEMENLILDFQDHFETLIYILGKGKGISHREMQALLNGKKEAVGDDSDEQGVRRAKAPGSLSARGEAFFRDRITNANEWGDLELLFRTIRDIKAQAMVLSLPLNGAFYDSQGIPRSTRQVYYEKLRDLAQRYGVGLIEFEDHDGDPSFQIARREHPTAAGWGYYDQALDKFFHGDNTSREERSWRR